MLETSLMPRNVETTPVIFVIVGFKRLHTETPASTAVATCFAGVQAKHAEIVANTLHD